jgi:hypothetical protein
MIPEPPVSMSPLEAHPAVVGEGIGSDLPVVADWRAGYQDRLEQATATGYRTLARRLSNFGRWSTVLIDTILLVVAEVILSIILGVAAFAVIFLHGDYLGRGISTSTAVNHAGSDLSNWLTSPIGLGLSALVTQGAIFLVLQLRVVGPGVLSWSELGWGPALRQRPLRAFLIGLGIGLAAFVLGEVLLLIMHAAGLPVSGQQQELKSVHHSAVLPFLFFAISAAITAPIAEETFFRAYAMRALAVRYGFPVGVVVSSLFFGLLHLTGGVGLVALPLMVIGALLAWAYARTGNLITNITAHALNNLIGVILLLYST